MVRTIILLLVGALAGRLFMPAPMKYPLKVTLYRFQLNKEKRNVYGDWIRWQHEEHAAIVQSLDRERMYFESVFRDSAREPDVIYWLAVNGEGGAHYDTSPLAVDQKHDAFMRQILVKGGRTVLQTEFVLMPPFIENSIGQHQAEEK